ncbi:MAG: hypothetical protein ACTHZ9_07160 [Leucobacter sp.]
MTQDTNLHRSNNEHQSASSRLYRLYTPYHALGGAQGVRVPAWAKHRSVFRGEGRTTYLVETDQVDAASNDLYDLATKGWNVHVERDGKSNIARVAVSQDDLARAA